MGMNHKKILRYCCGQKTKTQKSNIKSKMGQGKKMLLSYDDPSSPIEKWALGSPGGAVVKNPPANAGDMGSSPGWGRSHMPWSN